MKYPKDEILNQDQYVIDRWVDLKASPVEIWPWLAQMGNGRAGWYSYDWLDNLGKKSFLSIDPKLGQVFKNQKISFAVISEVEEQQLLTYQFGTWGSFSYFLERLDEKKTRLWTRARFNKPSWFLKVILTKGHLFMQHKQFKEIKIRVENPIKDSSQLKK
jgi:hypothetical protein